MCKVGEELKLGIGVCKSGSWWKRSTHADMDTVQPTRFAPAKIPFKPQLYFHSSSHTIASALSSKLGIRFVQCSGSGSRRVLWSTRVHGHSIYLQLFKAVVFLSRNPWQL